MERKDATLGVTSDAASAVLSLLNESRRKPEQVLRLVPARHRGFRLSLSKVRRTDRVVCCEGRPVLVLGRKIDAAMDGLVLDVQKLPEGDNLTLRESGTDSSGADVGPE